MRNRLLTIAITWFGPTARYGSGGMMFPWSGIPWKLPSVTGGIDVVVAVPRARSMFCRDARAAVAVTPPGGSASSGTPYLFRGSLARGPGYALGASGRKLSVVTVAPDGIEPAAGPLKTCA